MLILVVGPSGAGKDALLTGARAALGEHVPVRFVRRIVTRSGGRGDEDHESVTEQEFMLRQEGGEFALSWRAHGLRYAIPADISADLARGRLVVANVSRAVVAEAAQRFPAAVIEVCAPIELRRRRLHERGREDAGDLARRLVRGIELPLGVERLRVENDGTLEEGVRRMVDAIREIGGREVGGGALPQLQ